MKIIQNPDSRVVKSIRKALKQNDGYCPCALIKDKTTKCMCKEFRESGDLGPCHCGLYVRVRKDYNSPKDD